MFMGEFTHSFDDKGRLTIPAKFRDELARGAVVTRGFDRNLALYPAEAFHHIVERANRLSTTHPENRMLMRLTFSGASEVVPDRQGRITVPIYLRDYAGIQTECVIVGVANAIEIWSPDGWAQQLAMLNDPAVNAARFAALDLSPGD
jgi:MraZ protein